MGIACAVVALASAFGAHQSTHRVLGLVQPAQIIVDQWGIPHIYAQSARDAFFVQGFNAARDRLWQIDLWRKRGLGLLAKNFGPKYVEQDRAARLFLYRGSMDAEWAAYPPDAKSMTEAFVGGINAYVRLVNSGALPLPLEFRITDTRPQPWSVDDVVRIRSHALASNVISEVTRAAVACAGGIDSDWLRWPLEPAHQVRIPQGLDVCSIPADVLKTYFLAVSPALAQGSNAWTVAPRLTTTGRPILANDPHRAHSLPSLRYLVHLEAPGLSFIGAGEPALPGISLGHNREVAWGLTIFNLDQEDLYIDSTDNLRVVKEMIEVRGGPPQTVELPFTSHGPVLRIDEKTHRAFALRTVWAEPGTSGYFAASWALRAKNWHDFLQARDHWGVPALNLLYADRSGNIGWSGAGKVPRRHWDGLLPVPGDGRYEWAGFIPASSLPSIYNPMSGWFASANEMNLPPDYPAEEHNLSFEWANRARIERINEVLSSGSKLSLATMRALQTDTHNAMAQRLTRLLHNLRSSDPQLSTAVKLLAGWDGNETTSSAAAALYQVWVTHYLGQSLVARIAPARVQPLIGAGSLAVVIDYLEHPDARLGDDPSRRRDELLLTTLTQAVSQLQKQLGADPAGWAWGRLHQLKLVSAVARVADPAQRTALEFEPIPLGGSGDSPAAAGFRANDFSVTVGASVRMILDVGNWDASQAINLPGQSGDPNSPHYSDLLPVWSAGGYVPLLYSRAAIQKYADRVLNLVP